MKDPSKTRKPARCGDRLATDMNQGKTSHVRPPRASLNLANWRRERERLLVEAQRTRSPRYWLAAIQHQAGIVSRLESEATP
jgi:hypothetical protein